MRRLLLMVNSKAPNPRPFFQAEGEKAEIESEGYSIPSSNTLGMILEAALCRKSLADYDAIVTTEYFSSFGLNLRLLLTFSKIRHVIIGLNQSRRVLSFNIRPLDRLINAVFRRTDAVITHSRKEIDLFVELHEMDRGKFHFSHWGFDLPEIEPTDFSKRKGPYLSFIGRNNRDIQTFCKGLEGLDVHGVVITAGYNRVEFPIPGNIEVFYDLDMNTCLDCMWNALANVVLVHDGDRGAGHITLVASMLMGKPQIVSDVAIMRDYVVDGCHGIAVPLRDPDAFRRAVRKLAGSPDLTRKFGMAARDYANRHFTNGAASRRAVEFLSGVMADRPFATCDAGWKQEYDDLVSSAASRS